MEPDETVELHVDEEKIDDSNLPELTVEFGANGLPLVVSHMNRIEPDDQPCGDATTSLDSLIRLSFDIENGAPTDVIEVTVTEHKDEVEELLIEIDR